MFEFIITITTIRNNSYIYIHNNNIIMKNADISGFKKCLINLSYDHNGYKWNREDKFLFKKDHVSEFTVYGQEQPRQKYNITTLFLAVLLLCEMTRWWIWHLRLVWAQIIPVFHLSRRTTTVQSASPILSWITWFCKVLWLAFYMGNM